AGGHGAAHPGTARPLRVGLDQSNSPRHGRGGPLRGGAGADGVGAGGLFRDQGADGGPRGGAYPAAAAPLGGEGGAGGSDRTVSPASPPAAGWRTGGGGGRKGRGTALRGSAAVEPFAAGVLADLGELAIEVLDHPLGFLVGLEVLLQRVLEGHQG